MRRLSARALTRRCVRELRVSGADRVRNCDCLVYPKGHRDERVFFFEADDGSVHVCALGRHSDRSYEQLIERGVREASNRAAAECSNRGVIIRLSLVLNITPVIITRSDSEEPPVGKDRCGRQRCTRTSGSIRRCSLADQSSWPNRQERP